MLLEFFTQSFLSGRAGLACRLGLCWLPLATSAPADRTLPAIILAAIVNIVCNYLLVQQLGVYGAIATSIISYLVLFFYRLNDMKRYFKLSFYPRTSIAIAVILIGAIPYHYLNQWWQLLLYMVVACAVALMAIPKETIDELLAKISLKKGVTNNNNRK